MSLSKPASTSSLATNPLLLAYLSYLASNPLLTKCVTSGFLSFNQEVLGSRIAGVTPSFASVRKKPKKSHVETVLLYLEAAGISERAAKMAVYGGLISAPLGHYLTNLLQKAFAGKTTARDRVLMIIAANLFIAPIQNSVYLLSMAYINGARTLDQASKTLKAGFWSVMRISWITSPISIAFAQKFLPPQTWEVFFNLVRFVLGTYFNVQVKRKQLALARKQINDQAKRDTVSSDMEKQADAGAGRS